MRHDYGLTDETRRVMTGKCPAIAEEMDVADKYIYGILSGTNPDPFAYFLPAYKASIRAGADVTHWDAKLASVKLRKVDGVSEFRCISELEGKASTAIQRLIVALEDGVIEPHEWEGIGRSLVRLENAIETIRAKHPNNKARQAADAKTLLKFQTNGRG